LAQRLTEIDAYLQFSSFKGLVFFLPIYFYIASKAK